MSLITIILVLIVVGVLLWLIGMIPMDRTIHTIIRVVIIIAVVLWLLRAFGLLGALSAVKV
jgi:hypothetical protein